MTLKEEGCSDCKFLLEIVCKKPVAHTTLSFFGKLGTYWDEEKTGRPRITSVIDDSMMKFWFVGILASF